MKSMKWLCLAVMFCLVTNFAAAAGERNIHTEGDKDYNFAALKTFEWAPVRREITGDPRIDNPVLDQDIRLAVNAVLIMKGFKIATDGNPDFWVNYEAAIVGKMDVDTVKTPYYAKVTPQRGGVLSPHWNALGDSYGPRTDVHSVVTTYEEGTLVIDIADAKTKKLIWRGAISDTIKNEKNDEKLKKKIDDAVMDVLKQFPPQSK